MKGICGWFIILNLVMTLPGYSQLVWRFREIDSGVKPEIAIDSDDNIHIAYMLEAEPGFVKHAQLTPNFSTTIETLNEGYFYGPLDIKIGPGNMPHVQFHNHDEEDQTHWTKDENGDWIGEVIKHPGHDGWDNSLYVESSGLIHTSSVDPVQFGSSDGVEYAFFDGNNWSVESIGSGPIEYQFSTSIHVDSNGNPHITYFESPGDEILKYAEKTTGKWRISTIDNDAGSGRFSSLVLDENDKPAVSYYTRVGPGKGMIEFAIFENDQWTTEKVEDFDNIQIAFEGARNVTSLTLVDDIYHLTYGDREVIKYAQRINGMWEIETVVDESGGSTILGQQTSLALNSEGVPYIIYYEVTGNSPLRGRVKLAFKAAAVTAIGDEIEQSLWNIYPNPAQDGFYVEGPAETINLSVINMSGQVIQTIINEINNDPLFVNTSVIKKGIYLIQLETKKEVFLKKILINN